MDIRGSKKIISWMVTLVLVPGVLLIYLPGMSGDQGIGPNRNVLSPAYLAPMIHLGDGGVKSIFQETGTTTDAGNGISWNFFQEISDSLRQSRISTLPNRRSYVQDLVTVLQEGNRVQVAFLSIQNFKGEFNDRGAQLDELAKRYPLDKVSVAGHEFGDWGIQAMADLLPQFLVKELAKQGSWGTGVSVYNDAKSYWVVFQNAPDDFKPADLFRGIFAATSEFKQAVVDRVKRLASEKIDNTPEIKNDETKKNALKQALNEFSVRNFNIYGGISESFSLAQTDLGLDAVSAAHRLDSQALLSAKHAQLYISGEYLNARVNQYLREERGGKFRLELNGEKARELQQEIGRDISAAVKAPRTGFREYSRNLGRYIAFIKQFCPRGEWDSIYRPITVDYHEGVNDKQLLQAYQDAAASGDPAALTLAQENIFKQIIGYSLEPDIQARAKGMIFFGNDRFKDTINYLIEHQPAYDWSGTFRIGGDEIGKVVWNARTRMVWVFRFDINNLGKINGQLGVRLGDKIIDEMIRLLDEIQEPQHYMAYIYNYFRNTNESGNNLRDNPITMAKEDYDYVASRLTEQGENVSDYLQERGGTYQIIQFPPVTVRSVNEETGEVAREYRSGAAISAGVVAIDANIINEQKAQGLDVARDYSGMANGRADGAAEKVKADMKDFQLHNNGAVSAEILTALNSTMWAAPYQGKTITSLPATTLSGIRNMLAEFIVTKAKQQAGINGETIFNFNPETFRSKRESTNLLEQAI